LRETLVVGTLCYMQSELHAKVSRDKYPQNATIGGFGAKTYASDSFLRVLTVYFPRAAAATPTCGENFDHLVEVKDEATGN
jgi:hypothetical protein